MERKFSWKVILESNYSHLPALMIHSLVREGKSEYLVLIPLISTNYSQRSGKIIKRWELGLAILKESMHLYLHCSTIYNNQSLKAAQVPICRWVHEKAGVHLHHGILLSCKKQKKEILTFATAWMDLKGIMLSEINQSEKDRYYIISLIYGT